MSEKLKRKGKGKKRDSEVGTKRKEENNEKGNERKIPERDRNEFWKERGSFGFFLYVHNIFFYISKVSLYCYCG